MQTSESTAKLDKAMSAFQAEAPNPSKKRTAKVPTKSGGEYSYTYADLADIITAIRPLLAKHGLSVMQSPSTTAEGVGVVTRIACEGEWAKSDPTTVPLQGATAQAYGSAITYARRYSLAAMLGISAEDDDDGEIATAHQAQRPQAPAPRQSAPRTERPAGEKPTIRDPSKPISDPQLNKLQRGMRGLGFSSDVYAAYLDKQYGVTSLAQLTMGEASNLIDALNGPDIETDIESAHAKAQFGAEEVDDDGRLV